MIIITNRGIPLLPMGIQQRQCQAPGEGAAEGEEGAGNSIGGAINSIEGASMGHGGAACLVLRGASRQSLEEAPTN